MKDKGVRLWRKFFPGNQTVPYLYYAFNGTPREGFSPGTWFSDTDLAALLKTERQKGFEAAREEVVICNGKIGLGNFDLKTKYKTFDDYERKNNEQG